MLEILASLHEINLYIGENDNTHAIDLAIDIDFELVLRFSFYNLEQEVWKSGW